MPRITNPSGKSVTLQAKDGTATTILPGATETIDVDPTDARYTSHLEAGLITLGNDERDKKAAARGAPATDPAA